jgi:hypothetical protein
LRVYNYIDAVSVTEVPNFVCECTYYESSSTEPLHAYSISYKRKLTEPGSNECCYEIFINHGSHEKACHVNKAKIYVTVNGTTEIYYYDYLNNFFHLSDGPVMIKSDLCVDEIKGTNIHIKVELQMNNDIKCTEELDFTHDCDCDCPEENDNSIDFKLDNYNHENTKDKCCYDIKIINSGTCDYDINTIQYIFNTQDYQNISFNSNQNITPVINGNSAIFTVNPGISAIGANNSMIFERICLNWNTGPVTFKIKYGNDNGMCDKEWSFTINCQDCCDKINATIASIPVYDDGIQCCFSLNLNIPEGFLCDIKKIKVIKQDNVNGESLWESFFELEEGQAYYKFCLDKETFGGQPSIPVEIRFYRDGLNGLELFCTKLSFLDACSNMSQLCYPDYSNVPWIEPEDEKVHLMTFPCSPQTTPPTFCDVTFSYKYRHVKDQLGNSIHRDVQVYNYKFNEDCHCDEEKIRQILKNIWSKPKVIDGFDLSDEANWGYGTPKCFDNFRVITSDCWTTYTYYDFLKGSVTIRNKCPGIACCYAVYEVCYYKDGDGNITHTGTFQRQSQTPPNSQQCDAIPSNPPCTGSNCALWAIHGNASSPKQSTNTETYQQPCNSFVYTKKNDNEYFINIECEENGAIELTVFDLLGNIVSVKSVDKKERKVQLSLNEQNISGTYLLRINLNNQIIFYNKLNIVK